MCLRPRLQRGWIERREWAPLVAVPVDFAVAECLHRRTPYNTSIIVSDVGARASVWAKFMDDPRSALIQTAAAPMVGDDQVWR